MDFYEELVRRIFFAAYVFFEDMIQAMRAEMRMREIGFRHNEQLLKLRIAQLESLATQDALSGLSNIHGMETEFLREVSAILRSVPKNAPFPELICVLLIDLDKFKRINDTHGHEEGDRAIVKFSEVLLECFTRPSDILCRMHGDEFAVILFGTSLHGAKEKALAILEKMKEKGGLIFENKPLTASIGIAEVFVKHPKEPLVDLALALRMADRVMYNSKRKGRNQVSVYRPKKEEESL